MKLCRQLSEHTNVRTWEGLRKVQSHKCIQANRPQHAEEIIMPLIHPKRGFPLMSWGKKHAVSWQSVSCHCNAAETLSWYSMILNFDR